MLKLALPPSFRISFFITNFHPVLHLHLLLHWSHRVALVPKFSLSPSFCVSLFHTPTSIFLNTSTRPNIANNNAQDPGIREEEQEARGPETWHESADAVEFELKALL